MDKISVFVFGIEAGFFSNQPHRLATTTTRLHPSHYYSRVSACWFKTSPSFPACCLQLCTNVWALPFVTLYLPVKYYPLTALSGWRRWKWIQTCCILISELLQGFRLFMSRADTPLKHLKHGWNVFKVKPAYVLPYNVIQLY